MYQINDSINTLEYKDFQAKKLLSTEADEILYINLESNTIFPKHTSPRDAHLLMLEGAVLFFINDKTYTLYKHQVFDFPKDIEHWVEAQENAKLLIIR